MEKAHRRNRTGAVAIGGGLFLQATPALAAKVPILAYFGDNPWLIGLFVLSIGVWIYFKVSASDKQAKLAAAAEKANRAARDGDHAAAFEAYRILADEGITSAQSSLAHAYLTGTGTAESLEAAIPWFLKAAEGGDAYAERILGVFHAQGKGVAKDPALAHAYLSKAAQKGDDVAKLFLGHLHFDGLGTARDLGAAASWYRDAAGQGNAEAAFHLAQMLQRGDGVPADLDEARGWYEKAAGAGHAQAREALAGLDAAGEALRAGTPHPTIPNLVYGGTGWMPADGFEWASQDAGDTSVRFKLAGQPVPGRENCVYDTNGGAAPAPGYRWASEDPGSLEVVPDPQAASDGRQTG